MTLWHCYYDYDIVIIIMTSWHCYYVKVIIIWWHLLICSFKPCTHRAQLWPGIVGIALHVSKPNTPGQVLAGDGDQEVRHLPHHVAQGEETKHPNIGPLHPALHSAPHCRIANKTTEFFRCWCSTLPYPRQQPLEFLGLATTTTVMSESDLEGWEQLAHFLCW